MTTKSKSQAQKNPFEDPEDPNASYLETLTSAMLTPLVQRARDSEHAEVTSWTYERLKSSGSHGGEGQGVYRFTGQCRDQERDATWAMILKVIQPIENNKAWSCERELHAYQSGLLNNLPGGLAAPRCFDIAEQQEGTFWLWIEALHDAFAGDWPLERYGLAARHLGQFNGAYLTNRPLPSFPWLSHQWLRHLLASEYAESIAQLTDNLAEDPLVQELCPQKVADRIQALWDQRERWLQTLERLPQTLCYMDAWRPNLFARRTPDGRDETVAIDWTYTGIGAIGEDLAPLVFGGPDPERKASRAELHALDHVAFPAYLNGLANAGWQGDPRVVRLGFVLAITLRYVFMYAEAMRYIKTCNASQRAWIKRDISSYKEHLGFLLELTREAEKLIASTNF